MRRVLLIRVSAIGDVVLLEPMVRALKERFSGVEVDLITAPFLVKLMAERAGFDQVYGFERHQKEGISTCLAQLDSSEYDLAIDLQAKVQTRRLLKGVKATQKKVLQKRSFSQGLLSLVGYDPPLTQLHNTQIYLKTIEEHGIDSSPRRPVFLGADTAKKKRIAVAPCAQHQTKQWPIGYFQDLLVQLKNELPDYEIVAAAGPKDGVQVEALRSVRPELIDTMELSLDSLARALEEVEIFVGVDTGPTHMAAALGAKVIALFGPTSPTRWGPIGETHQILSLNLSCAPCSNTGGPQCPKADQAQACMKQLSVAQVMDAIKKVVA